MSRAISGEGLTTSSGNDVDTLIEHAATYVRLDAERSAALLDRAESAMDGTRDLARAARVSEMRGALALRNGHLGEAATAYRHARRNWLALGRRLDAIRAAMGCTRVQLLLGEFADAEAAVNRMQAQLRHEPYQDRRVAQLQADAQRQLADAHAGRGSVAAANRHYDTAGNLYAALGDAVGMAEVHMQRGLVALDAGLTHNGLLSLGDARTEYIACGQEASAATAAALMAEALATSGQVARALEVLDCLEPDLADTPWNTGILSLVRSNALLRIGFPAEAHAEARRAEEAFTEVGAVESSARASLASAAASLRWGRVDAAASELSVAERLFAECGSNLMLARTYLAQAELAVAVGDPPGATAACERMLAADLDDTAPSLGVQARLVAARVADPQEAQRFLDEAADLAVRTGMPELRVDVLLAGARLHRRLGRIDEAIDALRTAITEGRAWATGFGDDPGTVPPALAEATDELITLLLQRNDRAGQVEAWQRARLSATAHPATPATVRAGGSVPPATKELRHRRLDTLLEEVGRNAHLAGDPPSEEVLPGVPWTTMVTYYVTGDDILAFVLRDGQVDARVLSEVAPETWRLVRAWRQECRLMSAGIGASSMSPTSSPALDGLYEVLLAPVADLLADLEEDVRVIGHRHLHAVPFDALLDEEGPWSARLERRRSPHRASSRSSPPRPGGPATLVLAVPDENAPLITAEAEMVFRTFPTAEILLGAEATHAALARGARSADVVHLACHGVFRQDSPLASALRLGDGWLQAREILTGSLTFDGAVVVLSACGSGLSPDYASAPVGLVSACLTAGASGVVAALWTVDDAVTLELMTHFYRSLSEGLSVPCALSRARRRVAERHPHPYYWAAFRYIDAAADDA